LLLGWERDMQLHFNAFPVHFEKECATVGARYCSVQVIDHVDRLAIYLEEDVANLHVSLPSRRLCVDQEDHHAWLVHH